MKGKIIAVIPAFNEEKTIGEVVKELKKLVDEIIVVDDASVDRTGEIAKANSAIVLRHDENQGYDKTINDGFIEAAKRNAFIIFTFDADGQHAPDDAPKILAPIKNGEADVVVGIRPYKQRISEKIFSRYAKRKIGVSDPLCGVKAYSAKAYDVVGYFDKMNSIGTELMFNCYKNNFRIKEVTIRMNKREGKPRFGSILKGNLRIISALVKIYIKFR